MTLMTDCLLEPYRVHQARIQTKAAGKKGLELADMAQWD